MNNFSINTNNLASYTLVSNVFLDQYLPSANGSYIKVYLYLLRRASSQTSLNISSIADALENTESDILRALRYWQKEGVLTIEYSGEDISSITFEDLGTATGSFSDRQNSFDSVLKSTEEKKETPFVSNVLPFGNTTKTVDTERTLPTYSTYSPMEQELFLKDSEVKNVVTLVETMMDGVLDNEHINFIIYIMNDLNFSSDLAIHLYEVALKNAEAKGGKRPKISYFCSIAENWARKDIQTVEEAVEESSLYNAKYNIVKKHLGLDHNLTPEERAIIDGWEKYCFSETFIIEACKRTILQIGKPSLNYATGILENWSKNKVRTIEDIEKLDQKHQQAVKDNTSNAAKSSSQKPVKQAQFSQRTYSKDEFVSLEKQLLMKNSQFFKRIYTYYGNIK